MGTQTRPRLRVGMACLLIAMGCGDEGRLPVDVVLPSDTLPTLAGSWEVGPSLPFGVHGTTAVVHGEHVYLVGGSRGPVGSDEGTIASVLRVSSDGAAVSWDAMEDYPLDGMHFGLAVLHDTLFAIGGLAFPSNRWARAFAYDVENDVWLRRPDPPERLGRFAAVPVGDRIVAVAVDGSGRVYRYDPAAESWIDGAPMVDERGDMGVALWGDTVITVGGDDPASIQPTNFPIQAYEPLADRWRLITHAPETFDQAAGAVLGDRVHMVGGRDFQGLASQIHLIFDLDEGRWYRGPDLPVPVLAAFGLEVEGSLWVIGGWSDQTTTGLRRNTWIYRPES